MLSAWLVAQPAAELAAQLAAALAAAQLPGAPRALYRHDKELRAVADCPPEMKPAVQIEGMGDRLNISGFRGH